MHTQLLRRAHQQGTGSGQHVGWTVQWRLITEQSFLDANQSWISPIVTAGFGPPSEPNPRDANRAEAATRREPASARLDLLVLLSLAGPHKAMQSAHPANLFQSDASLEVGQRRATKAKLKTGRPIYIGKSQDDTEELAAGGSGADGGKQKVLAALVDGDGIWTAEGAGVVRRVDLARGETTQLLLAHKAPVSALALHVTPGGRRLLFSAGWDKAIHVWDVTIPATPSPSTTQRLTPLTTIVDASTDFIKALHVFESSEANVPPILLSGGSDKLIRMWDLTSLFAAAAENTTATPPKAIGTFPEHTRAVTCITSLPHHQEATSSARIFSADSMGRIFQLQLSMDGPGGRAKLSVLRELRGPETSISCISAGWTRPARDEDDEEAVQPQAQAQVWVGSHDKTARLFVLGDSQSSGDRCAGSAALGRTSKIGPTLGSQPALSPRLILPHDDYVKSLLPLHLHPALPQDPEDDGAVKALVVTGCADEDVRVFRASDVYAARAEDLGVQCIKQQQGHWHEVEFLGLWNGIIAESEEEEPTPPIQQKQPRWYVISTGLDASIRRWELSELLSPHKRAENGAAVPKAEPPKAKSKVAGASGMTAEEERELEELMMSDDDC